MGDLMLGFPDNRITRCHLRKIAKMRGQLEGAVGDRNGLFPRPTIPYVRQRVIPEIFH